MTMRLVRLLEIAGRDATAVCRRAGVSREEVTSLSARVPYAVVDALVESCVRELGVAEFAIALSAVMDENTYDAAGLVLMSSATFGEGLERAFAYQRLWADGERFTFRCDAEAGVIGFEHPGRSRVARAVFAEVAFVETMNAARVLVGSTARAARVTFAHERGSSLAQALGVEPIYGARRNELVLEASLLAAPIRLPEGALARMHEILAKRALADLPGKASLASQLRAICKLEPSAFSLDVAGIAARLHLTRRTLQRRLAAEGTSWSSVVDDARRARVRELELRAATDKEITFLSATRIPAHSPGLEPAGPAAGSVALVCAEACRVRAPLSARSPCVYCRPRTRRPSAGMHRVPARQAPRAMTRVMRVVGGRSCSGRVQE